MSAHQLKWHYDFQHPIEKIWPWVSDTNRTNRGMGLPAATFRFEKLPHGGTRLYGKIRMLGMNIEWREYPYEWVKPRYFQVEREYLTGPAARIIFRWDLERLPNGGCRLSQNIEYEPRNRWSQPVVAAQLGILTKRDFLKLYQNINQQTLEEHADSIGSVIYPAIAVDPVIPLLPTNPKLVEVRATLARAGIESDLTDRLSAHVLGAQDPDLTRIRPFVLAQAWQRDRREILSALLKATHAGVLNLSWDLVCPRCRGAKVRALTLKDLNRDAHCESCNIDYGADFDRSVELSFVPHPGIRRVSAAEFCAGSPNNTPFMDFQLRIPAKSRREIEVRLEPGAIYSLLSLSSRRWFSIVTGEAGPAPTEAIECEFSVGNRETVDRPTSPGLNRIIILNPLDQEVCCSLERAVYEEMACTAAYVTSLQEFREMFSTEVVRMGERIEISSLAILFTDLKDSTLIYQEIGDAAAFELVGQHLKSLTECVRSCEGAVVKTIGDAVMATFSRPEAAVEAALKMHETIRRMSEVSVVPLKLKVGIHYGPCFVMNVNDRLDYFGSTVNIAARVQGHADPEETLISQAVAEAKGVTATLKSHGYKTSHLIRNLKGFRGEYQLYRITPS